MSMNNLAASYDAAGQARRGPQAPRGDAGPEEGQARPRPPRHAHEHEQPGRQLRRPRPAATEALKLNEETLALQKAKLGPDHPDTLRSMHNLAICYRAPAARPALQAPRGDAAR